MRAAARRREKGPPRAGNARVRRGMIQSAWRFLIFQKESALAQWYRSQWPSTGKARYKPAPAQAGVYKARNILERLPKPLHACVRKVLRQASELDDADNAERLISNLARRLEQPAPRGAASILEGLDEILTVIRLSLPAEIRRALACTDAIEKMMGLSAKSAAIDCRCEGGGQTLAGCFHGAALD